MTTSRLSRAAVAAALALSLMAGALVLGAGPDAGAAVVEKNLYSTMPFMTLAHSTPQVMLVILRDPRVFRRAYNNLSDINGDGKVDLGFDPSITYFGYFDPEACYAYHHSDQFFYRSGWADKNHPEALKPTRPQALERRLDVEIPKSANGVCTGVNTDIQATWHGNWLNWFMSSQMDVLRMALYGGKRYLDAIWDTVLTHSFVPPSAHAWAVQLAADDIWADRMRGMPYYDGSLYTGFPKPENGKYNLFYRYQVGDGIDEKKSDQKVYSPLMGVIWNSDADNKTQLFGTEWGIWDFVAAEGRQPDLKSLKKGYALKNFNARVKICDPKAPGGLSPREKCHEYNSDAWKSTGILQEYGSDNRMFFGLLATPEDEKWRKKGGVLRRHVESMSKSFDYVSGIRTYMNLFAILDQTHISGWDGTKFVNNTAWGSPLGEMVFESVRYFSGAAAPSCPLVLSDSIGTIQPHWERDRPKNIFSGDCSQPIVVVIGHAYPDYDSDDFPDQNGPEIASLGTVGSMKNPHEALKAGFDKASYLKAITELEGYGKEGGKYYFSRGSDDDCSAKPLASLNEVKGLCPEEPAREGSYSSAAVAWFAHTHNLSPVSDGDAKMDFYTLSLPSPYPEIRIDLGGGRVITAYPFSETGPGTLKPLVSYFVADWQTDSTGLPFYIKIVAAFEE
ncbi:MAG: hypothetical protein LBQ12_01565, partial [Deltaproteobacteria bacterium]|nr:hypothetical protein [Deltaproteobacteria bacterium]